MKSTGEGQRARAATLQDYWSAEVQHLILSPVSGKRFTRLHLPLAWEDGTPTPQMTKAMQTPLLARPLAKAGETEFEGKWRNRKLVGPDRRAQWRGTVLRSISLKDLLPPAEDSQRGTPLSLYPFRGFPISLHAKDVFFVGNACFDNAYFSGDAVFQNAAFSRDATFSRVVFSGDAQFTNATFSGLAGFDNAAFAGDARFDKVAFCGDSWFHQARFVGTAEFRGASFFEFASFQRAAFFRDALFRNAAFSERAEFRDAIFLNIADFSRQGAELRGTEAAWTAAVDSKPVKYGVAKTGETTAFKESQPLATRSLNTIRMDGGVFLDIAIFNGRDIYEPSSFRGCLFFRRASFHGSKLHQGVSFQGAEFAAALEPQRVATLPRSVLQRLAEVDFLATGPDLRFKSSRKPWYRYPTSMIPSETGLRFEAEQWEKSRSFRQLPQASRRTVTGNCKDEYFADLEDAFRTLKRVMEENRNRQEEARFFKLELQARAKRSLPQTWQEWFASLNPFERNGSENHVPRWERWASWLYGRVGAYGNSAVLPLAWLACIWFLFAQAYVLLGNHHAPLAIPRADYAQAYSYSAGRVLPFGPWVSGEPAACTLMGRLLDVKPVATAQNPKGVCKDRSDVPKTFGIGSSFGVRLLASLQSVFALILVFLAALAARRRFQIN